MIILAKLLSNALFVIYMSQDPVLSMEPRHARPAPSTGKGDSVLNCLLLIVKLLLSIKNSWIESRVDNKDHNLLCKLTPTSTLALCRRAQVPLIDITMFQSGPGDTPMSHWSLDSGVSTGKYWGDQPM